MDTEKHTSVYLDPLKAKETQREASKQKPMNEWKSSFSGNREVQSREQSKSRGRETLRQT